MDILAARKKAADRAKAAKAPADVPPGPAETEEPSAPAVQQQPEASPAGDRSSPDALSAEPTGPEQPREPAPEAAGRASEGTEQPDVQAGQERELEMLSFLLGGEEYVVEVDRVKEVLTPREITPVPHTAEYLLGVCSLRGIVMPVIDLNRRLGIAAGKRDEKSRIIVVGLGLEDQAGLFVDRVRGVVRFPAGSVRPAPENVDQGTGAEFLKGIARKDDRLYILLDVEKAAGK